MSDKIAAERRQHGKCIRCGGYAPTGLAAHHNAEGCVAYQDVRIRQLSETVARLETALAHALLQFENSNHMLETATRNNRGLALIAEGLQDLLR